MFRRCKVTRLRRDGWALEERFAWVPVERAIVDAEIVLAFRDGEHNCAIAALDTLVIPGRFLPHVEEWPVERTS